ncbi:GTP 3',8-cyclase MoaA [Micrococcales bacterium 31B]|nr:GTP 3',8-cyclase MoaA [Micrococcales bacterium 31B]
MPTYRRDALADAPTQAPPRPPTDTLLDQHGRIATDLRVSLTDQCNLRCTYCMPAEGLQWLERSALMQRDEIARLLSIATRDLGVTSVRFTGGEPLLRHDLTDIIADARALDPSLDISLTTNAIGLSARMPALVAAGLSRVNVSLDSVDPDTFTKLTRRPLLPRVLEGVRAAHEHLPAGQRSHRAPVKINAVLLPGVNDTQAADLLGWCLERGYQLRFIEQMPLDADHVWDRANLITAASIRAQLEQRFTLTPDDEPRLGAPAQLFRVAQAGRELGRVGIIASITENFCADCTRTRLTAEGRVRNCLFARSETDLLTPLREGANDREIADLWRGAMWTKWAGHRVNTASFTQPDRPMSAIGG